MPVIIKEVALFHRFADVAPVLPRVVEIGCAARHSERVVVRIAERVKKPDYGACIDAVVLCALGEINDAESALKNKFGERALYRLYPQFFPTGKKHRPPCTNLLLF